MTTKDLIHRRLCNQQVTATELQTPAEMVAWMVAVQAQDFAAAKWALGMRLKGMTDADVDAIFNAGDILRTHVMRPTWHFVAPADIRWLLKLTAPRVKALNAFMNRQMGVDAAILKRSSRVIEKALTGRQLTRPEINEALNKAGIATDDIRSALLLMEAELDGLICSGPRKGKQFTYALLDERVPATRPMSNVEALATLATRYFISRGPATLQDFVWWSGLAVKDAREALEMIRSQLVSETIDKQVYWFSPSTMSPKSRAGKAYLLPNYDEYLIAYKDRLAVMGDVANDGAGARQNVIFNHAVLIDGVVEGTWKRTLKKDAVVIETVFPGPLSETNKKALSAAAKQYGKFIGLPVVLDIIFTTKNKQHEI
jgi:hypothetical protein